ncbi:MAG: TVP38/TMEM64 family protein [Candidatus Omnitrophica bacterium]|nr:TVP38/TMEM64 family protein [Candidatus Omnitrophota bacterium]
MARRTWIKLGILAVCLASLFFGLQAFGIRPADVTPDKIRALVLSFGVWAPIVYLATYGQPIVPLPASVMTITGGLAFGPWWGTWAALTGATIRACGEFLIARLLGRQAVERLLRGKLAAWDAKLAANGFTAVLLIRLVPNLPFDMQNYGLGFSRVRFSAYAPATVLGMIPGSFAYVYLGYSLTDPKQLWKLGLAILLIIGLMLAQRAWSRRRQAPVHGGRA